MNHESGQNKFGILICRQLWINGGRALCSFILAVVLTVGSIVRADLIDDTVGALMQKSHLPGLSLAVVQDGKIVKAAGYGVRSKGSPSPVTDKTLFQAGTLSQAITALGALALVESGKVSLDADTNETLKTWRLPGNELTESSKVTLRELLNHTAGLTVPVFQGYAADAAVPSLGQILEGEKPANSKPIRVEAIPGAKWHYSSGGYAIVQRLITDVTNEPFQDFISANVLRPLGMTASNYEQPLSAGSAGNAATGHVQLLPLADRWYLYPELAATGLWTTPSDLARFSIAIQQAFVGSGNATVTTDMAHEMLAAGKNNFGLGFALSGLGSMARFSGMGRSAGFFATTSFFLTTAQGAVVMVNNDADIGTTSILMATIACAYDWPDYRAMKSTLSLDDRDIRMTELLKNIFAAAQHGKLNRSIFTTAVANEFTGRISDELQKMQTWGNYVSLTSIGWNNNLTAPEYCYILKYERKTLVTTCAFDQKGKIAALDY